jgi:soluble lytic murein transglycosylase
MIFKLVMVRAGHSLRQRFACDTLRPVTGFGPVDRGPSGVAMLPGAAGLPGPGLLPGAARLPGAAMLLGITMLLGGHGASAQTSPVEQAFARIDGGDQAGFAAMRANLTQHPLLPYLDFAVLMQNFNSRTDGEIAQFLETYTGQVVAQRVRRRYLSRLAARANWPLLLKFYRGGGGASLRCSVAAALWATGSKTRAIKVTDALWRHGESRPDACNPAFKAWADAGQRTPEAVWDRFALAVQENELALAGYLARELSSADAPVARLWLDVHARPIEVTKVSRVHHRGTAALLNHGYNRLTRQDEKLAARSWREHSERLAMPESVRKYVERRIGLALATSHDEAAVGWLASVSDDDADDSVRAWRVASALRHGRFGEAEKAIKRLQKTEQSEARWLYWAGRVAAQRNDADTAKRLFSSAAGQRDFFGFLAAELLGMPYALNEATDQPTAAELAALQNKGAAKRAAALRAIGRLRDARREWYAFITPLGRDDKIRAGYLASSWEWHAMAIITMGRAKQFDALAARFPTPFEPAIVKQAKAHNVERDWVRGVMRQESAYLDKIVSSAGAMGLMQIMPATGRVIARRLGVPFKNKSRLFEPEVNIRFGASYLSDLREKRKGHIALATASYNAGPHRIKRWLPESGTLPADVWIESIPYHETRGYVKSVLEYAVIYAVRAGRKPLRLTDKLTPIRSAAVIGLN